jgi:hypothetical protein
MSAGNLAMLEQAAVALGGLVDEVVFVGGATVGLWLTDEAAPEPRATRDVDVIVEIATQTAYSRFEEQLRGIGFADDQSDGVICRFRHRESGLLIDAMPMVPSILGFEGRWIREAFPKASDVTLPSGRTIRVVTPPYLLATKLEAFRSRGEGDLYGSADFEDVVVLVDGREELATEVAGAGNELRAYVAEQLGALGRHGDFGSAAEGALRGGPETRERFELVVAPRIEAIIAGR